MTVHYGQYVYPMVYLTERQSALPDAAGTGTGNGLVRLPIVDLWGRLTTLWVYLVPFGRNGRYTWERACMALAER